MDSALRPRDIQARIRAGDTPDSVAALAAVPVERIMPYCVPVLAERRHVAETAGRSHVRRANADGQSRRLGDVVTERLRGRGVDPETVEWDAWRRDDARWTVLLTYLSGESLRAAHFVFDQAGRYSLAEDDEARWLTGERQSTVHGPQPRDHSPTAGDRRLAVVPRDDDLLSLAPGDLGVAESHDYFTDESYAETSDDLTAVVRAVREGSAKAVEAGDSANVVDADVEVEVEGAPQDVADQAVDEHSDTAADQPAEPQRRKRANRRASVPSWDEIMLGRRAEK
jgi:hypothetical protein